MSAPQAIYLILWILFSLLSASSGGYFYPHYWLEVIPVLVLSCGLFSIYASRIIFCLIITLSVFVSNSIISGEKKFGLAAKQFLVDWISKYNYILVESTEKGKFGRILGRLYDPDKTECWNDMAVEHYHAVPYHGQSKDDIKQGHLENRKRLTESGFVL